MEADKTDDAPTNKNLGGHHDLGLKLPAADPAASAAPAAVADPDPAPAADDTTWHMPEPEAESPASDTAGSTATDTASAFSTPDTSADTATSPVAESPAPEAEAWHMPDPVVSPTISDPIPSVVTPDVPAASSWAPAPPVPSSQPSFSAANVDPTRPVPVVRVLSPNGVEYVFMTTALIIGAVGLTSALLVLVNGKIDFTALSFPVALLLVGVPVFAVLFLHLKKAELMDSQLKLDASKRRSTQFIQIASFVVSIFTLIGFVFSIFAKIGGADSYSIVKTFLDTLCVLVVAGGILAYYWRDEHKTRY